MGKKNYKNMNFNNKDDYLYALYGLIEYIYPLLEKYIRYNGQLGLYLEEIIKQNKQYIDFDICEEWKDSINVETVSENDQVAQVKLTLGYGKGVSLYAVNLVKEKGKWLMDSVKPISHSSIYCPRQAEGGE